MKKTFVLILFIIGTHSFGQTKDEIFKKIQTFANKAVNQEVQSNNVFSKEPDKLTRQLITEREIIVQKKGKKKDYEWIERSSEISWNDLFEYILFSEFINNKLQIVQLRFDVEFKSERYASDDGQDFNPDRYSYLEFYVLTSDKKEVEALLNQLYNTKESKAISPFIENIKKFSKEQTIDWLKLALQKHMRLGTYDSQAKIVSLDACKLVVSYRGLVREYVEELPTDISSIDKYGYLLYSTPKASIHTTTPDLIDKGEKNMNASSSSVKIDRKDQEAVQNIEFALKHLAAFCSGKKTPVDQQKSNSVSTVNSSTKTGNTSQKTQLNTTSKKGDEKYVYDVITYPFKEGGKYIGEISGPESTANFQGIGTYYQTDDSIFFGSFVNGNANGWGIYMDASGEIFRGYWKNDEMVEEEIPSQMLVMEFDTSKTGCIYGDCTSGFGVYLFEGQWAGDVYVGNWKQGIREGVGTYYYSSGDIYCGEYKQNEAEGTGTYYHSNNELYIGLWKAGKRHGNGLYIYADNQVKKGVWKDNVYQ